MQIRLPAGLARLALGAALAVSLGCSAGVKSTSGTAGSQGGAATGGTVGSTGAAGSAGSAGTNATAGTGGSTPVITIDGGGSGDAACTPSTTCAPAGGHYCGKIGNGCKGGSLECGACAGDGVCTGSICIGGPSCQRISCSPGSARYCGTVGDGCGSKLECGACPTGQVCNAGVCASANCVPLTCTSGSTRYCGTIGDGCGGTLACGDCAAGSTCGGGGVPGVCTATNCAPITCNPTGGGQYCGRIGNGCAGVLDCPACPGGMACGTGAQAGVCPGVPGTGGGCTGIQCNVATCTGTAKTTVSGTIYDPAGVTPLYNAVAYVPNAALDPIPTGASCDRCNVTLSGKPIATALSDVNGKFTLEGVPTGANIPLVIQVGKWRRQVMIPSVTACVDNPITDVNLTRLPRSKSEGNIPKIAVTTGSSDAFECLLRKIGVADAEYTLENGSGRINLFAGGDPAGTTGDGPGAVRFNAALGGGTFPSATTLWGSTTKMKGYDLLIFSCEGSQYGDVKTPYLANVKAYADAGGRIFADHLHYYFFRKGPAPWPSTAAYIDPGSTPPNPTTATINTGFPKGAALADWMVARGASTTRGQMQIYEPQHAATAVMGATQNWISIDRNANDPMTPQRPAIQYMTFNTPVEAAADAQCGRSVFTAIHLNAAPAATGDKTDLSNRDTPFPDGCRGKTLSAQEKALEFLFFDLSACVQPDTMKPVPPPTVPPPGVPNSPPGPVAQPPAPPPPPPPPPPPTVD